MCVMGNQQKEGVHYQLGELYASAPVMTAAEVRLCMAIAAKHRHTVGKSEMKRFTSAHPTGGQNEFQMAVPYY